MWQIILAFEFVMEMFSKRVNFSGINESTVDSSYQPRLPNKTLVIQGTHTAQDYQNFRISSGHNRENDVNVEYDGSYSNQIVQIWACETNETARGRTE